MGDSAADLRRNESLSNASGEEPALKIMIGAIIRAAEHWRAITVSGRERRQMRAVGKDRQDRG